MKFQKVLLAEVALLRQGHGQGVAHGERRRRAGGGRKPEGTCLPGDAHIDNEIAQARKRVGAAKEIWSELAAGDLASGSDTIAISNVTWTASGAGYVAGTMSSTSAELTSSLSSPGGISSTNGRAEHRGSLSTLR